MRPWCQPGSSQRGRRAPAELGTSGHSAGGGTQRSAPPQPLQVTNPEEHGAETQPWGRGLQMGKAAGLAPQGAPGWRQRGRSPPPPTDPRGRWVWGHPGVDMGSNHHPGAASQAGKVLSSQRILSASNTGQQKQQPFSPGQGRLTAAQEPAQPSRSPQCCGYMLRGTNRPSKLS